MTISFSCSDEIGQQVIREAKDLDRPVSYIVRQALEEYFLRKHRQDRPPTGSVSHQEKP